MQVAMPFARDILKNEYFSSKRWPIQKVFTAGAGLFFVLGQCAPIQN